MSAINRQLRSLLGITVVVILNLVNGSSANLPLLKIASDSDQVSWEAIIPPTTNFYPSAVGGTNFYLQVSTNLQTWQTIYPVLDSFPDIWVTNDFAIIHPAGFSPSTAFFRITNNDTITNSGPNTATILQSPMKIMQANIGAQMLTRQIDLQQDTLIELERMIHIDDPDYPPLPPTRISILIK